jgi:hypothetical protein
VADDWTLRVAELRDLADDALTREDHEVALARVAEAFTIVDAEGNQQHPVFASLLCVAADLAMISDELDSARSLYMRAHQVGAATEADGAVVAKALVGIGSLLEADGEVARAIEHYRNALSALQTSTHEDAELARAAITDAIQRLQ